MTEADPMRRYVEAGLALTQLTRAWAEAMVKDLVKAGDVQRENAQDRVEELVERSRKGTEAMVGLIRKEIGNQLSALGFATKDDLERMEQRLTGTAKKAAKQATTAKKASTPKAAATKAAAKKAPAKKAPAKKAAAKKGGAARGASAGTS
jgi:polyhydroxyalkanoate synthesis regulator phasin